MSTDNLGASEKEPVRKHLVLDRVPITRMLKLEVARYAEDVIAVVQAHNPKELQIEPLFNLLLSQQPLISQLKSHHGVDPYRLALKPKRELMVLLASNIKLKTRMLLKTNDPKDLFVLKTSVDRYLRYLHKARNSEELLQRIAGFVDDANNDPDLADAISEYALNNDVQNLEMALDAVLNHSSKRYKKLSLRPKESTQERTQSVLGSIEYLYKEIEVAQFRHLELDYEPLVDELNVYVKKYRGILNRRELSNKRKAALKEGNTTDNATDDTDLPTGEDATTEVPPTDRSGSDEHETAGMNLAFTNEMDIPLGPTSSLELRDDLDEDADQNEETSSSDDFFQESKD